MHLVSRCLHIPTEVPVCFASKPVATYAILLPQGEMINESGTMSGGGGKPRGGRMCLGTAAPKSLDTRAAAAELQAAEQELSISTEVCLTRVDLRSVLQLQPAASDLHARACN